MKIENKGEDITIGHQIVQKGLNFLSSDFEAMLEADPKLKKQFDKLVDKGVFEIL